MIQATIADLPFLFPTTGVEDRVLVLRSILGRRWPPKLGDELSHVELLQFGFWQLMVSLTFVSDAQRRAILSRLVEPFDDLCKMFEACQASKSTLPTFPVVFASQRWVVWPDRNSWFDMKLEEDVTELPNPVVISVTCDVTSMFVLQQRLLAQRRGVKSAF